MAVLGRETEAEIMEIKYTMQGLLINQAIILYVLTLLADIVKFKKCSLIAYALAFTSAILAMAYRGIIAGHFPLQNLFDVFLCLGAMALPISMLSKRFLQINDYKSDVITAIIVLFPVGFVFSAQSQSLPPALQSKLFVPHVMAYMLAYIVLTKAAVLAAKQIVSEIDYETAAYKLVCVAFPLLTTGLILGSIWAKSAWGDYWSWDPKEMWALATWLVYVAYFHYRASQPDNKKTNSLWLIAGFIFIVITLLWVNLSKIFSGMHSYA